LALSLPVKQTFTINLFFFFTFFWRQKKSNKEKPPEMKTLAFFSARYTEAFATPRHKKGYKFAPFQGCNRTNWNLTNF
jgi:hypothetical protein